MRNQLSLNHTLILGFFFFILSLLLLLIGYFTWYFPFLSFCILFAGGTIFIFGLTYSNQSKKRVGLFLILIGVLTIINNLVTPYKSNTSQNQNIYLFTTPALNPFLLTLTPPPPSSFDKKQLIDQIVKEIKKEVSLPYKIDWQTTLIDVTAEADALRYYFLLKGENNENVSPKLLKENLVFSHCQDKKIETILNQGIKIEYVYSFEKSPANYTISLSKEDCQYAKKN